MENKRINGNDLLALGYAENSALGVALQINKKRLGFTREQMLAYFSAVLANPEAYVEDAVFKALAQELLKQDALEITYIPLKEEGHYEIYGEEHIEEGAKQQMQVAMTLPVAVAGALMPDAHQGYGLPIGGVLATNNAVIPYGVGVDIGCRMALSIFDLPAEYLTEHSDALKKVIMDTTKFGAGQGFQKGDRANHAVLEQDTFAMSALLRSLKDKAWAQLGTSGGGDRKSVV